MSIFDKIDNENRRLRALLLATRHDNGDCKLYPEDNCPECVAHWANNILPATVTAVDKAVLAEMDATAEIEATETGSVSSRIENWVFGTDSDDDSFPTGREKSELLDKNAEIRRLRDIKRDVWQEIRDARDWLNNRYDKENLLTEREIQEYPVNVPQGMAYKRVWYGFGKGSALSQTIDGVLESIQQPDYHPWDGHSESWLGEDVFPVAGLVPDSPLERLNTESALADIDHTHNPTYREAHNPTQGGLYGGSGLDIQRFPNDWENEHSHQQRVVEEAENWKRRNRKESNVPQPKFPTRRQRKDLPNLDNTVRIRWIQPEREAITFPNPGEWDEYRQAILRAIQWVRLGDVLVERRAFYESQDGIQTTVVSEYDRKPLEGRKTGERIASYTLVGWLQNQGDVAVFLPSDRLSDAETHNAKHSKATADTPTERDYTPATMNGYTIPVVDSDAMKASHKAMLKRQDAITNTLARQEAIDKAISRLDKRITILGGMLEDATLEAQAKEVLAI